jgi:RNA polymerase sigma-70 factor (ECF subfamily)
VTAPSLHNDLIRRARAADPEALSAIYEHYGPAIYRYIYFRVGDAELARDLHSEVFVRMLEGIDRYEDRGWSISAWLYRIAYARTIDALRRKERHSQVNLEPWDLSGDGPDTALDEQLSRAALRRAFPRLCPNQRRVLMLRYVYGLSLDETARQMGRSVGAIKSLQHRAIENLRRLVLEDLGEAE